MARLLTHMCVTRPEWVNHSKDILYHIHGLYDNYNIQFSKPNSYHHCLGRGISFELFFYYHIAICQYSVLSDPYFRSSVMIGIWRAFDFAQSTSNATARNQTEVRILTYILSILIASNIFPNGFISNTAYIIWKHE